MVTVERHLCVGNNVLFLRSLSLITLERYDVCAGFPADMFVMEKIGSFSITYKDVNFCHYIDLDLLWEVQRNSNSGGPRQRVSTKSVA